MNWSQYLALRGLAGFVQCFDINANLDTAASIGSVYYRISQKRRQRAEDNIRRSFPEWPQELVSHTAERSFQHMFQLFLVESIMSPRLISHGSWFNYVRLGKVSELIDMLVHGRAAMFVTGHCGNWELLGTALAAIGYPLIALARPIDNPLINDWLLGIRERLGLRVLTKWGATPLLQQSLRTGGRVAFIADQNAGDQGLFVPFFGRLASSYKSIGLLAMRYHVPIVAGHATRQHDRFEYELNCTDIIHPHEWADQPDPLFYITARYNRAIERMVRAAPEQYLWVHRRWKSRPKHEREGQPTPARLIAKLEQLPWMTQAELDRLR